MIPPLIKTDLITPLTQIKSVTPVTAMLDSQGSATEFEQGQRYQAFIEARLPNGNSRILIADKFLQMRLPEDFQPGSKLELAFISHTPKLEFLILSGTPLDSGENNTSISAIGRFLGILVQDTLKRTSTGTADTISTQRLTSSPPILPGPLTNSTELSSLLQKTIVQSGLFYESHQAQWINGENTLENLQQEPQGKLILVATDLSAAKAVVAAFAPFASDMLAHPQSIPLVQQQLSVLDTGYLFWRGEVWQGQLMEWDIFEQSPDSKIEPDYTAQWCTKIHLSMPQLGNITATIALNGQDINIKLNTSQLETASLLRNNKLPFTIDMQSAGLTIQSMEVQHDDEK